MVITLLILFSCWTILSIWAQLPNARILKYNFFGFVPYCRFFSPNPVSKDLKLYYRFLDNELDKKEIIWNSFDSPQNGQMAFIWSPEKKLQKSLNTLVRNLMFLKRNDTNIEFSIPYLTLLNIIQSDFSHVAKENKIQFLITRHKGFKSDLREALFISKIHTIEKIV